MKKSIFILLMLFFLSQSAYAATRIMQSCSQAAFNTAYSAAVSGDTIEFPSGSCSINWSGTTSIAKTNILIKGSGAGNTILTGAVFSASGASANGLRVTGVEFRKGPAFEWNGTKATKLQNVRFDHCKFYNGAYFFSFYGAIPFNVVIDSNTFDTITGEGNYVFGESRSTDNFPFTLGTGDGVYFEDNVINATSAMGHFIASRAGSRYIIRYNTFNNLVSWDPFDAHDNYEDTSDRGSFTWEIYENKINYPSGTGKRIIHMRGGQGVIFNNYTNLNQSSMGIFLTSYRICAGASHDQAGIDHINHSYIWGNKMSCGSDITNCSGGVTWPPVNACYGKSSVPLIINTDYWTSAMPGYTPYTYPHPLRNEDQPPTAASIAAPKNLSIIN